MQTGHLFIRASNVALTEELKSDNGYLSSMREDVVEGFKKHIEWLKPLTDNPKNRERVKKLAKQLNLNYQMKMFGCMGDDFDKHTNMVLNALMVLTMPSLIDSNEEEFVKVFDNSIDTFRKSRSWMVLEAQLEEKLNDDLKNCGSYATKMAKTKEDWWKPKKEAVEQWLRRFGITYINVLSQDKKGMVSRQIYERLNKIRIDKQDESHFVPMTNNDLCQYLKLESELMFYANKIEEFRKLEEGEHKDTDEKPITENAMAEKDKEATPSKKTFMKHEADERKLPSVMRDANKQHLDGQHHAVVYGVSWKDYHVALCLMFYLRTSNNAVPAILSGLTRAYYNSFSKKEFTTMCTYEQFHKTMNKLNDFDFKKVIAYESVDEVKDVKIGHGTLQKWYEFYHRLLPIFKLHLPERDPEQEKNGFVKLT